MSLSCSCCGRFGLLRSLAEKFSAITEHELRAMLARRPAPLADGRLHPRGEYLFTNGTILTLSDQYPEPVEAIWVRQEQIVQVGALAALQQQAPQATLIDLHGACLMPGLIDPHAHIVSGALDGLLLDLSPPNPAPLVQGQPQAYDIAWVQGQLQQAVNAADPTNGWVLAAGFDASKLTSWVNLTSRWFAENMHNPSGIPIIVQAGSGHLSYANAEAMALAGITALTPDPVGGIIGRFEDSGALSGVFVETPAQSLLKPALLARPMSLLDDVEKVIHLVEGIGQLFALANRQGITTLNDAGIGLALPYEIERMLLAVVWEWHNQPVRLASAMFVDEWDSDKVPAAFSQGPDMRDPMFSRQAIKLFSDGSNQGVTGFQRKPYSDWALARTQKDYLGLAIQGNSDFSLGGLAGLIKQANAYRWQVMTHANGDGGIDRVIQAHQLAGSAEHPEHRHRIEHSSLLHDEQLTRMRDLGLSPSFLIEHVGNWGEVLGNILGEERVQLLDRCRSALDAGLKISLHSDYPVTDFLPLQQIDDAVTRVVRSNNTVLNPAECLTVEQALRAKTLDAAWQCHIDQHVGSLEAGKCADFVVLARDPRTVNLQHDAERIADIAVLQTWVNGRQVYQQAPLA